MISDLSSLPHSPFLFYLFLSEFIAFSILHPLGFCISEGSGLSTRLFYSQGLAGRISCRAVFIARAGGCYILTRSWLSVSACCPYTWKRLCLGELFLGYIHSLRSFPEGNRHSVPAPSDFENGFEEYWGQIYFFNSGKFFWFMFMNFFCYTYWIFYFRKLILCFITFASYITFLLRVWDDVFPYFLASTEIISHLYSVPYSIFSRVYFVLSCSDLFISAVLVSFHSKSVSLVLQPFLLIYYLVFELVLLDSYFYWRLSSLRQPRRSPSWIMFSPRLSSWGGPGTQGSPTPTVASAGSPPATPEHLCARQSIP